MPPPIGTPGPQQSPQDPAVARRNRAFALGGGAVVALLVIAAVVALVVGGRHGDPEKAAASSSLLPAPSSVPNSTMPGTATPPSATASPTTPSPTLPPPTSTGMTGRGPGGLPADPKAMHLSAGRSVQVHMEVTGALPSGLELVRVSIPGQPEAEPTMIHSTPWTKDLTVDAVPGEQRVALFLMGRSDTGDPLRCSISVDGEEKSTIDISDMFIASCSVTFYS